VTADECLVRLRRRWYVLALVMLCAMSGVWAIHDRPIAYQGCNSLYVAAPRLSSNANTYTYISPSLAMATGMVTQTMMSQPMQQKLQLEGATAGYEVMETNTGDIEFPAYTRPTVQICSSSSAPQAVLRTTALVTKNFRTVLYQMQAAQHVPSKSFITTITLARTIPLPVLGRPSQADVGMLLVGLISGVALTLWSDSLLMLRNHRGAKRHRPGEANSKQQLGEEPRASH
jgi:hypothetical protein